MNQQAELQAFYDHLWHNALNHFQTGQVETDPFLLDRDHDQRRGLSVIARLSQETVAQIEEMLDALKLVDAQQYFYQPDELHLTVLSLFTATAYHYPYMANYSAYMDAVNNALAEVQAFEIEFRGVTASKGAVMVQGFPSTPQLEAVRDGLRQNLRERGLVEGLDKRYRIRTAHATVMRFQRQVARIERLSSTLSNYRETNFGITVVEQLFLVKNDWYMSTDRVEVLEQYVLGRIR